MFSFSTQKNPRNSQFRIVSYLCAENSSLFSPAVFVLIVQIVMHQVFASPFQARLCKVTKVDFESKFSKKFIQAKQKL